MQPIRTILVPTDFSKHAAAALDVARTLARDHGARLIVLHVEMQYAGTLAMTIDPNAARAALDEIRERVEGPDLKSSVETQLRIGDPVVEILEAIEKEKPDLVVVGSHGRTGLKRLLLGSVAEAVLRRSSCPVLTVRTPAHLEDTPEGSRRDDSVLAR